MCPTKEESPVTGFPSTTSSSPNTLETVARDSSACPDPLSTSPYEVDNILQRFNSQHAIPSHPESSRCDSDDLHTYGDGNDSESESVTDLESNASVHQGCDHQMYQDVAKAACICENVNDELVPSCPQEIGFKDTHLDAPHVADSETPFSKISELTSCLQENDHLIVRVHWELPEFCRDELDSARNLPQALVACGTASLAYSTTCSDYIAKSWPHIGILLLNAIVSFLSTGTPEGFNT